ncbi:MAG TPA: flagellar biosynthetic protein FliR [Bryobacteraceae bacterium]|nr:flagellar biosynthetic protein FliR [Bryobacteraceae bacterium]
MTLGLPLSTMLAFLLVLARVAGLILFLPLPAIRGAPDPIRVVFALALTFALFPAWPNLANELPSFGWLAASAIAEAGFGLAIGLAVGFLNEAFQLAAQILGVQAGYGFASTIDPASQADSGVLQVLMSLITGLLFFTVGIDRQLVRILAVSFEKFPAGAWAPAAASLDGVLRLGSGIFAIGLRLAMPVIALLLLLDLALALLGRMQQQLQLLSLAFPIKMLAALAILVALAPVVARIFSASAERTIHAVTRLAAP